jgi:hypothetical protein
LGERFFVAEVFFLAEDAAEVFGLRRPLKICSQPVANFCVDPECVTVMTFPLLNLTL